MYLILAKNDKIFWYKSVIFSVEVYDKEIITCFFHIILFMSHIGSWDDIMT